VLVFSNQHSCWLQSFHRPDGSNDCDLLESRLREDG
jgi:hypothetical protein